MLEALLHTATSNMRIKLLTLNIEHGGKLFDNIVRLIEEQDPDIVLFQEVYDSNLQDRERRFRAFSEFGSIFKEKLPFKAFQSSCFFITEIDEGAEHGNCIYSKFEIKSNTKTELSVPYTIVDEKGTADYSIHPAITQNLELIVDNQKLYVYNIHGVWGRDGLDSAARIEMAKRTLATDFKDDILAESMDGKRRYRLVANGDGTYRRMYDRILIRHRRPGKGKKK